MLVGALVLVLPAWLAPPGVDPARPSVVESYQFDTVHVARVIDVGEANDAVHDLGRGNRITVRDASRRQWIDPSPHRVRFVSVAPGVRLEVLDWGGTGEPLVFLAGLSFTAHAFDEFAPRFTDRFRVLAITRRGFGASTQPEQGYEQDTLVNDVRAVLDSLGIARAAFVGHSFGAHEITNFALTWPERVTRLINLDHPIGADELMAVVASIPSPPVATDEDLRSIATYLDYTARVFGVRPPEAEIRAQFQVHADGRLGESAAAARVSRIILQGIRPLPLEELRVPVLAIVNRFNSIVWYHTLDHAGRQRADSALPSVLQAFSAAWERYARGTGATIVDLPESNHHVYISNADEVFEAMMAFLFAPSDTSRSRDAHATSPSAGDTLEYVVLNHDRIAGAMRVVSRGDSVLVDYHHRDRFRSTQRRALYVAGADGSLRFFEAQGAQQDSAPGEVEERFELMGGTARWRSVIDSGTVSVEGPAFYQPYSDTPFGMSLLARYLLGQPKHTAALLPVGSGRVVIAADTTMEVGGALQRLRLMYIHDVHEPDGPVSVWLDNDDVFIASGAADWVAIVRRGAEAVLPTLRTMERAYQARVAEQIANRFAPPASSAAVIRDGDVFDSESGVVLPHTTVLIEGDRIVAVGPTDSVTIPAGARIIEAAGKTVLPGLWDMHTHSFDYPEGWALHLAAGVTTVRDLASHADVAVSLRERADAGSILSPRVLLAGILEGPGERAGPWEAIVTTENEARRWIARYDSLGYGQVKVYWFVHPVLLPAIITEAKERGMRVSGHVPLGINLETAVRLGFDEIQHAPELIANFFQDSTFIPAWRATAAVVASVAQTFEADGSDVTELLTLLRERGTVIDGTFNLFLRMPFRSEPLPDGTDPVFGPTLEWLPPLVRRNMALEDPPDAEQSARTEAARALYMRLIKRLFDAGVTIVPGTDNVSGLSYHGELEIYERAGIPAHRVLQIATIIPARVMGDDAEYGSIAPGKVADLVIVDGQPATRIRDLRRTEMVVRAGRVYHARDLYAAANLIPTW